MPIDDNNKLEEEKILAAIAQYWDNKSKDNAKPEYEMILDGLLAQDIMKPEDEDAVLDVFINAEQRYLSQKASELSDNLDKYSAEELENMAAYWSRAKAAGAEELRARIAARQEELRAGIQSGTDTNDSTPKQELGDKENELINTQNEPAEKNFDKPNVLENETDLKAFEKNADNKENNAAIDAVGKKEEMVNNFRQELKDKADQLKKELEDLAEKEKQLKQQLNDLEGARFDERNNSTDNDVSTTEDKIESDEKTEDKKDEDEVTLDNIETQQTINPNDPTTFNLDGIGNDTETVSTGDESDDAEEKQEAEKEEDLETNLHNMNNQADTDAVYVDDEEEDDEDEEDVSDNADTKENESSETLETNNNQTPVSTSEKTPTMSQEDAYRAVDSNQYGSMKPSELAAVRQALLTNPTEETTRAVSKLDDYIAGQAAQYTDDKLPITDMAEVYALNDLLSSIQKSSNTLDDNQKDAVTKALAKTKNEIGSFEGQYGLLALQKPEIVEQNLALLDGLPQDKDIFAVDEAGNLKNKEFQDVYNILSNIKVKGKLKAFGRETLEQGKTDSDIALFLEQTRRETEMYLANTCGPDVYRATDKGFASHTLTPQNFQREYADRLRKNLVELINADQISKGKLSQKDYTAMFNNLAQAAQGKNGINVNQDSFIGWQAARTNRIQCAVDQLAQRPGYEKVAKAQGGRIKSLGERVKETDQKLTKKYGQKYSFVKNVLKSGGWGVAYGIAGATFGPAGIAAVATVSCANQVYGIWKDFKRQRDEARGKGEKFNFFTYMKKNKLRTAGAMLSVATAAMGISAAVGVPAGATAQAARALSGVGLMAAGAFHQAALAYNDEKNKNLPKWKRLWKATKAFGTSAATFAAGWIAGREAGEVASEAFSDITAPTQGQEGQFNNTNDNMTPDMSNVAAIDVNNLSAEQQHDLQMLFLRDPAEANQILGQEGDQWMNSRELQQAWDDGTITDAQKAQLVEFGGQRFDEHGNFQDVEGYKTAAQMEADANAYSAQQNTVDEAPKTTLQDNQTAFGAPVNQEEAQQMVQDAINRDENVVIEDPAKFELDTSIPTENTPKDFNIDAISIDDTQNGDASHTTVNMDASYSSQDGRVDVDVKTTLGVLQEQGMPDDLDYGKVQFHDNGDITIQIDTDTGHKVTATFGEDGKCTAITSGDREYSQERLDYANAQKDFVERNQERYQALKAMQENSENAILKQEQTSHGSERTETPAQETPIPTEQVVPESTGNEISINKINFDYSNGDNNNATVTMDGNYNSQDGNNIPLEIKSTLGALRENGLPDDLKVGSAEFDKNGDVTLHILMDNGNKVTATIGENGECKSFIYGDQEYTQEQLDKLNEQSSPKNQERYQAWHDAKDRIENAINDENRKSGQEQESEQSGKEAETPAPTEQTPQEKDGNGSTVVGDKGNEDTGDKGTPQQNDEVQGKDQPVPEQKPETPTPTEQTPQEKDGNGSAVVGDKGNEDTGNKGTPQQNDETQGKDQPVPEQKPETPTPTEEKDAATPTPHEQVVTPEKTLGDEIKEKVTGAINDELKTQDMNTQAGMAVAGGGAILGGAAIIASHKKSPQDIINEKRGLETKNNGAISSDSSKYHKEDKSKVNEDKTKMNIPNPGNRGRS